MIFAEPNELNKGTLVHPSLVERSIPLPGLEERTGADFLIDAEGKESITVKDDASLIRACAHGMLIQRKRGLDLLNSIQDQRLFDAGKKMHRWIPRPWLTIINSLGADDKGMCLVGPSPTNWTYTSVSGALDWWQDPHKVNGGISFVRLEIDFAKWMFSWEKRLTERLTETDKETIDYQTPQPDPFPEEWAWLATLQTFPTIGRKKAIELGKTFGNLADVLFWMSSPELFKTGRDMYPKGIGLGTVMRFRKWLGLQGRNITWIDTEKQGDTHDGR